jgi:outer membrane protein assembly factor BamD
MSRSRTICCISRLCDGGARQQRLEWRAGSTPPGSRPGKSAGCSGNNVAGRLTEPSGRKLDLRFRPDSLLTSLTMPSVLPLHRYALVLAAALLLSFPARMAADLVWTPSGGWKIEGGLTSGLVGKDAHRALTLMNKARAEEEKKHYFLALRNYKKVIKEFGNSIYAQDAFYHSAVIRLTRHQYVKSFAAFQEIVSRFPNTPRFNEVVGQQYRIACDLLDGARSRGWLSIPGLRNREGSVKMFETVLANAPYSEYAPLALMSIARADQFLGNPEESIDALDRMINTYPKSLLTPDAYLKSAQAYASLVGGPNYDQTSTKQAITYFEDFVILYPGDPNIAAAEKGLANMKQVLAESKINIADYYLKYRRNYKAARVFYNEAITDYPESPAAARARKQLAKVDALLAEQEKARTNPTGKATPSSKPKKKWFLFF